MDGFFFARIDYDDFKNRLNNKALEMVWRGSKNFGSAAEIFTGVLYYFYGPPPGFCFDIFCTDPPIQVRTYNMYTIHLVYWYTCIYFFVADHSNSKLYTHQHCSMLRNAVVYSALLHA